MPHASKITSLPNHSRFAQYSIFNPYSLVCTNSLVFLYLSPMAPVQTPNSVPFLFTLFLSKLPCVCRIHLIYHVHVPIVSTYLQYQYVYSQSVSTISVVCISQQHAENCFLRLGDNVIFLQNPSSTGLIFLWYILYLSTIEYILLQFPYFYNIFLSEVPYIYSFHRSPVSI